jgi:hypothetical protein
MIEKLDPRIKAVETQLNNLAGAVSSQSRILQQLITPPPEKVTVLSEQTQQTGRGNPPEWVGVLVTLGKLGVALLTQHLDGGGRKRSRLEEFKAMARQIGEAHQALEQFRVVAPLSPLEAYAVRNWLRKSGGGGAYTIRYEGVGKKAAKAEEAPDRDQDTAIDYIERVMGVKRALGEEREEATDEHEHKPF